MELKLAHELISIVFIYFDNKTTRKMNFLCILTFLFCVFELLFWVHLKYFIVIVLLTKFFVQLNFFVCLFVWTIFKRLFDLFLLIKLQKYLHLNSYLYSLECYFKIKIADVQRKLYKWAKYAC